MNTSIFLLSFSSEVGLLLALRWNCSAVLLQGCLNLCFPPWVPPGSQPWLWATVSCARLPVPQRHTVSPPLWMVLHVWGLTQKGGLFPPWLPVPSIHMHDHFALCLRVFSAAPIILAVLPQATSSCSSLPSPSLPRLLALSALDLLPNTSILKLRCANRRGTFKMLWDLLL